jgi:Flp pilus assembly protein TadG
MIHGNEKGSSAVEFTLAAILFFAVLFSIVEYAIMSYVNLTMQHAVREGTRYAVTGRKDLAYKTYDETDPETRWLAHPRFNAMIGKIHSQSMGFFDRVLDPGDIVVTEVDGASFQETFSWDNDTPLDTSDDVTWQAYYPGSAGNIIVVKLNCTWPVITPLIRPFFSGGNYHFTVASTMKNEQFPPPP